MLDWKQMKHPAGTEVIVTDIHQQSLGIGVLLNDYDSEDDHQEMPRIRLADGRIIDGCDCWWIPKSEADEAKRRECERLTRKSPNEGR